MHEPEIRKVTVNLPAALLDPVLEQTGMGPTELFRELLERQKARLTWGRLAAMRGKVDFAHSYETLKELRD